jgi:AraC-like DNA-binding protein
MSADNGQHTRLYSTAAITLLLSLVSLTSLPQPVEAGASYTSELRIGFWDSFGGYLVITFLSLLVCAALVYYKNKSSRSFKTRIDDLTHQHLQLIEKYNELSKRYDRLFTGTHHDIESQDQRLFKKVQAIVENNLSNPLFGVEELAKEIGMSRTNLHRKIKSISSLSPSEFIRNMRLKKASILLLSQSNSVSQVSFSVGFEDHSYFSKTFKKHYGVSPSEYFQREMKAAS